MIGPDSYISLFISCFGQLTFVLVGFPVAGAQGFGFQADTLGFGRVARCKIGARPALQMLTARAVAPVPVRYRQKIAVALFPFTATTHVTAIAQIFHHACKAFFGRRCTFFLVAHATFAFALYIRDNECQHYNRNPHFLSAVFDEKRERLHPLHAQIEPRLLNRSRVALFGPHCAKDKLFSRQFFSVQDNECSVEYDSCYLER